MKSLSFTILATYICLAVSCATGGGNAGPQGNNENGSQPASEAEKLSYSKALLKCHKTGGTRVVKIEGQLRCF